jgi:CubicO group peptidase (beta-lactamase class C family)
MTMTAGFSEDSLNLQRVTDSDDPLGILLSRPIAHTPGSFYFYDDGAVHLLSILLSRLTGVSAAEFALEKLFKPLGVWHQPADPNTKHRFHAQPGWPTTGLLWKADRVGHNMGSYGLHLTLREMAKFGYLYLNGGRWEDRTLVPHEYVEESTRKQNEGGRPMGAPPGPPNAYALLWWKSLNNPAQFSADGFGGQQIMIFPERDMVIAMATSTRWSPWDDAVPHLHPCNQGRLERQP